METITLEVGTVVVGNGFVQDDRQPVEFVGERLARRTVYGLEKGKPTDTRGVTETLYRTEDGRLVVYVENWSRWQGEASYYHLEQVDKADLDVDGRFEDLGRKAGLGRPLTLDEVLM